MLYATKSIRRYRFSSQFPQMTHESNHARPTQLSGKMRVGTKKRYILIKILYKSALIFLGYVIAYMQWSVVLLFVAAGSLIWLENRDNTNVNKIKVKAAASSCGKQELLNKIDEIPSWVKFPDKERAEWLNQVIAQLWPTVNNYIIKLFRGSIQTKIRKKYESFRFENIDFGPTPPKIDGIKVYSSAQTKEGIIIDFDVFYDGDCDVNFSVSGAEMGGIRNFQLSVEVRLVLKPLLLKMPIIGGVQLYFLNTPDISFALDGLSSIPGLSTFIRTKIEEKIMKLIVFPNKITKRFSKSVEPSELKALEPAGVLRVHVFEAKDLMAKDISGKSDPYVILYLGAQERKTNIVYKSLNPKWDYWCEFVIVDPLSQHLGFKLYDYDNVNEDDFLGSGEVDISSIIKGHTDQWFHLENAKHGDLHLRFTWLSLSSDINSLSAISEETQLLKVDNISTAILLVYVDMAMNLPSVKHSTKPHPFILMTLGDQKQKSAVKKHTTDPVWEQGFVFLVHNPHYDYLHLNIIDKQTGDILTHLSYNISNLINEPALQVSKTEFLMRNEESRIVLSLQLRILSNDSYELEDEDSESDSDLISSPSSTEGVDENISKLSNYGAVSDGVSIRSANEFDGVITPSGVTPEQSVRLLRRSSISCGEHRLGRVELTLFYNKPRQKMLVTVHQASNIPLKHSNDIPDPYVKIKIMSKGHKTGSTHRTKVFTDNCNPVYDETFEYLFSESEAYEQTLLVTVKSKKFFHNNTIGQSEINLKYVDLNEPHRTWFDLQPKV